MKCPGKEIDKNNTSLPLVQPQLVLESLWISTFVVFCFFWLSCGGFFFFFLQSTAVWCVSHRGMGGGAAEEHSGLILGPAPPTPSALCPVWFRRAERLLVQVSSSQTTRGERLGPPPLSGAASPGAVSTRCRVVMGGGTDGSPGSTGEAWPQSSLRGGGRGGFRHRVLGRALSDASSQVAASLLTEQGSTMKSENISLPCTPPTPEPPNPPGFSCSEFCLYISASKAKKKNPILHLVLVSKRKK